MEDTIDTPIRNPQPLPADVIGNNPVLDDYHANLIDIVQIEGLIETVTTVPTHTPKSFEQQVKLYVDSITAPTVKTFYIYSNKTNTWIPFAQPATTPTMEFFHFPIPWYGVNGSAIGVGTANQARAYKITIPLELTVNDVTIFCVSAGTTNGHASVAVYSTAGNRLLTTGSIAVASAGELTTTLGAPVTLDPGTYWLAWTCDDNTATFQGQVTDNDWERVLNGASTYNAGAGTNSATSGVLPATLGLPTSNAAYDIIFIKLQN